MNNKKALLIFGFFINIVMFALGIFGLFISSQNNKVLCKYNGKLVKGSVYTDGKYTYKYMQEAIITSDGTSWRDINEDGWGVLLSDMQSTEPVIDSPFSSINNKPIVSMSSTFNTSKSTLIDLSNFDTSNVKNMDMMFANTSANEIKGLEKLDTQNVESMYSMFTYCKTPKIDLSSFDTSKVTNMSLMFAESEIESLNLSNFDTKNVTDMSYMFLNSLATTLNVNSFNTENVTDMSYMFLNSSAASLNVSSFNTENVTDMSYMFGNVEADEIIGLNNFKTDNVMNMNNMFERCKAETIDMSSFNFHSYVSLNYIFRSSFIKTVYVNNQDDIDVLNSFDISKPSWLKFEIKNKLNG